MKAPCLPNKATEDLHRLLDGKTMPLDFTFEGKRLPQRMIDECANGNSITDYSFAIRSAFRMAYMHMDIETDENGVVELLCYTTYQSSGSAYGDMFSRPVSLSDRLDEAMDVLLHIYDMYTDEELGQL